jgi:hypothetical protein
MSVDIQTYRARIGTFKHSRCGKSIENYRQSRSGDVTALVKNIYVSNDMKTAGCLVFIGILLMIAGVEPNPGPMWKGNYFESTLARERTQFYTNDTILFLSLHSFATLCFFA